MRPALALSLLGALGACFGTQDLKLGELGSQEPPDDVGDPMSADAGAPPDAEPSEPPRHHDDDDAENHDTRDAEALVVVTAAVDAAIAAPDASFLDAGAAPDAALSSDAGSDAASDAAASSRSDAGDAAGLGDAGDSGRSILCTLEPWHCL